jgi:predicted nuclease of predicted toxin-antitoxin system
MKVKLDENMPAELVPELVQLGHEAETVPDEGLAGCGDDIIWEAVQAERRFFITQDLDFSDLRAFILGSHGGVMLVRLRRSSRRLLIARVCSVLEAEHIEEWRGCFVVVTESKVRVRRPDTDT